MKLINKTSYDGRYLKRLFTSCEKHIPWYFMHKTSSPYTNTKRRVVTVVYSRSCHVSGWAYINSFTIRMKLPRIKPNWPQLLAYRVAQVYIHELAHNLGMHHNEMSHLNACGNIDVHRVVDYTEVVMVKPKKVKISDNSDPDKKVAKKVEHCKRLYLKWFMINRKAAARIKVSENNMKRYSKKIACYENKIKTQTQEK